MAAESKKTKAQEVYDAAKEYADAHAGNTCAKRLSTTRDYLHTLRSRLYELETQIHAFDNTYQSGDWSHHHGYPDEDDDEGAEGEKPAADAAAAELPPTVPDPKTPEQEQEENRNRREIWTQVKQSFDALKVDELRTMPLLQVDSASSDEQKDGEASFVDKCVYPLWRTVKNTLGLWRFGSEAVADFDRAKQSMLKFETCSKSIETRLINYFLL